MDVKLRRPSLDEGGYFEYVEGLATFTDVLMRPGNAKRQDVNAALGWLTSRIIVPEGEDEKKYKREVKKKLKQYSFNELLELVSMPEAEPDPK